MGKASLFVYLSLLQTHITVKESVPTPAQRMRSWYQVVYLRSSLKFRREPVVYISHTQ